MQVQAQKQKKPLERFTNEELNAALSLEEVEQLLKENKPLTPYHYELLKQEIAFREERKAIIAQGMYGKDHKLLQSKKAANKRLELIGIFREQQLLQNMKEKAARLYFEFKKMHAANAVPPELGQLFKETLDKLWAARRAMNQKNREKNIEENLDEYLANFNKKNHAV